MKQPKVTTDSEISITSNSPGDPRSGKRWGYISALPSEYLVHFRAGKLRQATSGQGKTCFKYPSDTVFIIPTSLKELLFEASQLTCDNVDVAIKGMAVYRISCPERIYELINFSNRPAGEQKLAQMIGDMCRSTAKWLVSNMKVDDCLRKRKEEIAETLKKEISLVVAGEKGWGVEVVTVDIQDVFIQDDEIFQAMQMTFKSEKLRESQLAQLEVERNLEMRRIENERALMENRKQNDLDKARIESEIKEAQLRLSQQNEQKQFEVDSLRVRENEKIVSFKQEQEQLRLRQKSEMEFENAKRKTEARELESKSEIAMLRARIEAQNTASPASMEKEFIEKALPAIAKVMAENMSGVKMNIFRQDPGAGTPLTYILEEVMAMLKPRKQK